MARQLCADQHAADLGLDRDARRGDQRADEIVLVVGVEPQMRLRLGEEHGLHRRAFEQDAFHDAGSNLLPREKVAAVAVG